MPIQGYADLLSFNRQIRTTTDIKARLERVSQEAVTGLRANLTEATNGDVGSAHLLRKALNDIEQSRRINTITESRIDLSAGALRAAREGLNGLDATALIQLSQGNEDSLRVIAESAEANLSGAISSFNARHGSRSLLSGDTTNVPPFNGIDTLLSDVSAILSSSTDATVINAALDTYFNDPAGGFETNIYQGSDNPAPPLRLSDGQLLDIDIRGNNQAIKDTLRGLAVLATALDSGLDPQGSDFHEVYSAGASRLSTGIAGLIDEEANLGIHAETITRLNNKNDFESLTLTATFQKLVGRDQFEAATELQQLQIQLESAFVITGRLANLSLTNFLR